MESASDEKFESSSIERFILLGNPYRYGVRSSAERLKTIIDHDRQIDFVPTGPDFTKTFQNLYDSDVDPKNSGIIIIGGDGTIRNVLESLRIEDDFREIPSIFTKFVGGARDLNSNLSMKKNNWELADLIDGNLLQKGYIYPIEATFQNDHLNSKIRAYNVLSIGMTALMAKSINQHQFFNHRSFQMLLNGIIAAGQLFKDTSKFEVVFEEDDLYRAIELIVTKGRRFAGFIKTTSKDLDPTCKLHSVEGIDPHFFRQLLLGKILDPSHTISHDNIVSFQINHPDNQIIIQADGDVLVIDNSSKTALQTTIGLAKKGSAVLTVQEQAA